LKKGKAVVGAASCGTGTCTISPSATIKIAGASLKRSLTGSAKEPLPTNQTRKLKVKIPNPVRQPLDLGARRGDPGQCGRLEQRRPSRQRQGQDEDHAVGGLRDDPLGCNTHPTGPRFDAAGGSSEVQRGIIAKTLGL
jgi:hypothetical protein